MIPVHLRTAIESENQLLSSIAPESCSRPDYRPEAYYADVAQRKYFACLVSIRHVLKLATQSYFSDEVRAKDIDLFMLTPSISSPMGPGSDSAPVPIQFGNLHTYLVDSSQFGFEPLMINGTDRAFCYLPSMRGEDPDARHLNQFFHCEYEGVGPLDHVMTIVEGYVRTLAQALELLPEGISRLSVDPQATRRALKSLIAAEMLPRITFDEAVAKLEEAGMKEHVNYTPHGRDIRARGEVELLKLLRYETPIWITGYDRDRVPFYQKPDPDNADKILNADLVFPALIDRSFGGEIVGSGQRQDSAEEMYESMRRQGVDVAPYEWYADLRRMPGYRMTSGFGLGIERFLAWSLCLDNIRDAILYPRLKNVVTIP